MNGLHSSGRVRERVQEQQEQQKVQKPTHEGAVKEQAQRGNHTRFRLLTRELLYVAVSRAKRAITLVGDGEALRAAVEQREQFRSGVLDMLANHRGS